MRAQVRDAIVRLKDQNKSNKPIRERASKKRAQRERAQNPHFKLNV